MKRLFAFLAKRGVILQDPTLDLELPHWKKLPHALLNQEQARRLVANPSSFTLRGKRNRAILETLYGTGIRVSECERLDVRDLDLGQGLLLIRDGKGRKDRVVPIVGRALEAIDLYLHEVRPELVKDPRETALDPDEAYRFPGFRRDNRSPGCSCGTPEPSLRSSTKKCVPKDTCAPLSEGLH